METFFFPDVLQLFRSTTLIPGKDMSFAKKMNSITRLIIVTSLCIFIVTRDISILFGAILAVVIIIIIYNMQTNKKRTENFENCQTKLEHLDAIELDLQKTGFYKASKRNPFSNVLLPEIKKEPRRKPAPPAYLEEPTINQKTKQMVQVLNPEIEVNSDLFGDIAEKFNFEQSQRQFYSTSNTRVANDQGAFADWLYGDMPSAKEGDPDTLMRDNTRYILR